MDDLSLHILDVAENSVTAGASVVEITVEEIPEENRLSLSITDDGRGMDEATLQAALDPFMTTKKKAKSVGLGLPFLAESAQIAGGYLKVESIPGAGTRVTATMEYDNIDRRPLGNLADTIVTLVVGYPEVDFRYVHTMGKRQFVFTTWEFKEKLNHTSLSSAAALRALKETVGQGEAGLR
jgi:anti-sigma regulatory factor (Ser/Thr protein kinase)